MSSRSPARIDAVLGETERDTRNPEPQDRRLLGRGDLMLDPGEAASGGEARAELVGLYPGKDGRELGRGCLVIGYLNGLLDDTPDDSRWVAAGNYRNVDST